MKLGASIALLSLAALGGTLVVTNPTEEDYAAYLAQNVTAEAQVALCQPEGFSQWLGKVGEVISGACQEAIAGGQVLSAAETQAIIVDNTDYQNRVFFSTYITETPFGNYRAIGVFDRFFLREVNSPTPDEPFSPDLSRL